MVNQTLYCLKKKWFLCLLAIAAMIPPASQAQVKDSLPVQKQPQKVVGRVSSQKGELLARVTIQETGSDNATLTDEQGTYTITVSGENAQLQFSSVGYLSKTLPVPRTNVLDVALEEVIAAGDEVVVVGFGTQKKASVVGAISTVTPRQLQLTPSRSISNNLAGMVSGVLAVQRSGDPWANNSDFWIRGISTFGNASNRPLVLIDGVERNLNNIDPEEIESFSVLKDAAASAVYGVRGANGVIIINTKRGKIGAPKVTARFERAQTSPTQLPQYVGAVKYLEIMNEYNKNSGNPPFRSDEIINNYRNNTDPELYPDVNWWNVIARNHASNMRANANVSGGNNFLRYALEMAYFDEEGIIKRDPEQEWNSALQVKRYNVRSNVDVNLSPTTLLTFRLGGFLQTKNGPASAPPGSLADAPRSATDVDIFYQASMTPPYVHPAFYKSGQIPRIPFRENPWAFATQRGYENWYHQGIESSTTLEQDLKFIIKGLKARLLFAFDKFAANSVIRFKNPDYYAPASGRDASGNLILNLTSNGEQFLGSWRGAEWGTQSVYTEAQLSYGRLFGGVHDVNTMLLYNQRNFNNGQPLPFRYQGMSGRFSYAYDRRYVAEFNFGYNGSENFAKGNRFGFFPSVAAGWVISEEKFMQEWSNAISKLKIRGSWGKAGNSEIGGNRRFAYLSTIENTGSYWYGPDGTLFRLGRTEGEVGVNNLTWETVTKSNLGFELGLWKGAIDFQIDIFKDKREDIFMQRVNIPGSSGFARPIWANFGKVNNRGVDLSLNGNKAVSKDFSFSVLVNYTYAKNEIIERDEPAGIIGTSRSLTGKPVGQLVGYVAEGLFTAADFNADGTLKEGIPAQRFVAKVAPGDIRYKDLNGDGEITALDQTSIGGTVDPQQVYGFGVNLRFKAVEFGVFFQGAGNTYRILGGDNWLPGSSGGAAGNILTNVDDRWTVESPSQDVFWPRLSSNVANNALASTWWLRDMSYLRLRNIELGYSLPKTWIDKIGMSNCRIFARGSNVLTFSKFDLWDPEVGSIDGLRYPIMKSWSAGFNINFK